MSIGEVAAIAGVNTSAIRHWENEGLIRSKRDKNSGYRIFSVTELRKILLISSLRKTIYYIENMRELLDELDTQNLEKIEQAYTLALGNLNEKLQIQFAGIADLSNYINMLKTIKFIK
ncbi:MerR family transcriptional regulator [Bacillus sp. APMAM]|nr:MerR family transcriptional regulator [Bacillus sp. APMAM]RTZ54717.1 MerR family transcriptional regulator [Bacillus sp. SAJ1]